MLPPGSTQCRARMGRAFLKHDRALSAPLALLKVSHCAIDSVISGIQHADQLGSPGASSSPQLRSGLCRRSAAAVRKYQAPSGACRKAMAPPALALVLTAHLLRCAAACTSVLVGAKASTDGSTYIARTDDTGDARSTVNNLANHPPREAPAVFRSNANSLVLELPGPGAVLGPGPNGRPRLLLLSPPVSAGAGPWACCCRPGVRGAASGAGRPGGGAQRLGRDIRRQQRGAADMTTLLLLA